MGEESSPRVLVVAKRHAQENIGAALKRAGCSVVWAQTDAAAAQSVHYLRPHAIVLHDHALDGREAEHLTTLAGECDIPLLVLQEPADPEDSGLEPPPLPAPQVSDLQSLVEQIEALTERLPGEGGDAEQLVLGDVAVDLARHIVRVDGSPRDLTQKEFELVVHLMRRPGWVFSRQQLLDVIWGDGFVDPRVVTVHVGNLRKKLGDTGSAAGHIETVRNVGYRFADLGRPEADRGSGVAQLESGSRAGPSDRVPFVSRERELAALERALASVLEGQTRVVAVVGDTGIGKTRLAEEFGERSRRAGVGTYWGRCSETMRAQAYAPWGEVLAALQAEGGSDLPAAVFASHTPDGVASMTGTDSARMGLFERLATTLLRQAESDPICLVFDDIHWADTSTLLALQHVIRRLRDTAMMLLVTHRPAAPCFSSHLVDVAATVVRSESGLILPLQPFSVAEVKRFVQAAVDEGVSPEVAVEAHRQTQGNPFFLTQFVHLLALQQAPSVSSAISLDLGRDEGVRTVVVKRLTRLSPSCRACLDAASVLGRDFTSTVLAQVVGLSAETLAGLMAEAVESGMVLSCEGAPERLAFAHCLFRDVVYNELPPERRATLHGRAGAVLERLHAGDIDVHLATLAHHFSAAAGIGCADKAVDACFRAAEVAKSRYAWEEACSLTRRGLDLVGLLPAGASQRDARFVAGMYEDLGDLYGQAGDTDRAVESYEDAACRLSSDNRVWRARLKRKQGRQFSANMRHGHAQALLLEAETLLGRSEGAAAGPTWWQEAIEVQIGLGTLHYAAAETEQLDALLTRVWTKVESHGSPEQRRDLEQLTFLADLRKHRFVPDATTIERAQRSAEDLRATGSAKDLLRAEMNLALALALSPERSEGAYSHLSCYLELAMENHDAIAEADALGMLSLWHRLHGDVRHARDCALRLLALAEERRLAPHTAEVRGDLAWAALRSADTRGARAHGRAGLKELQGRFPRSAFEWRVRWPLLGLSLVDGDMAEAVSHVRAILAPSQQKMPDDVEALLDRFADGYPRRSSRSARSREALTTAAATYGYL